MNDRTYSLCCCLVGQHNFIRFFNRPWRRCWRKTIWRGCLRCGWVERELPAA